MKIKQTKFTKSAEGEDCTLRIPEVCNYDNSTTVLCHLPDDTGTGKMGGKSDDLSSCYGCNKCHDVIDARDKDNWELWKPDLDFFMRRGMLRTWWIFIEKGLIVKT